MYDQVIKSVDLTADEVDIISTLLLKENSICFTIGEEIVIKELLDKLK